MERLVPLEPLIRRGKYAHRQSRNQRCRLQHQPL